MRARSAVSRPSSSQPAQYSIRIGCRFGWISNDSSRESVHFTGRPVSHDASAVWAWLDMSSLPPNAPPFATSSTVTRPASMPSTDAIWSRSSQTPWPPDHTCSPSDPSGRTTGATRVDSGSRNACSMRWVWNTSCTTCALAASAASTSPRAYVDRDSTLPSRPHTASSAPDAMACARIDDRRQRPIVDLDELCGGAGGLAVLRDDHREDVTQIGGAPAFGDEDRPVLVDQPDAERARYVGGGEDAHDTRHRGRGRHVDADDVGAGVRREMKRAVEHAGKDEVVDIRLVAERELEALVAKSARADTAARGWFDVATRARAARSHRGSSRSPCTGRGARRGGAPRLDASGRRPSSRSAPSCASRCRACRTHTAGRRSTRRPSRSDRAPRWACLRGS